MSDEDNSARVGFLILTVMRFSGAALALFGAAVIGGKVDLPPAAGYVLTVVGAIEALLLPALVMRRFRTPPQ